MRYGNSRLQSGLNDAPSRFQRTLDSFLTSPSRWTVSVDITVERTRFDNCFYYVIGKGGAVVGAISTHVDDILGAAQDGVHR